MNTNSIKSKFSRKAILLQAASFLLFVQAASAQTQTDFNQSGLSNFKTRVLPILNGLVAVFAILGIFYAAFKFFSGDADTGKKFLTSIIIGGVVWFVAAQIVNAL